MTVLTDLTLPSRAELDALRAWRIHGSIPGAATALGLSEHTIRAQLRNVRSKLGVHRTAQAAHQLFD